MYTAEFKQQVVDARVAGFSVRELEQHFSISRGTASVWSRGVVVSEQGLQRLQARKKAARDRFVEASAGSSRTEWAAEKWNDAYKRGRAAAPSVEDALAVGLYMGDGTKRSGKGRTSWGFTNANLDHIKIEVAWARRAGQPTNAFRAKVHVHPADEITDQSVRLFWAEAWIPVDNISILRVRSRSSKKRTTRRTPYGTCQVQPVRNGVYLYAFYEGQRDAILSM